MTKDNIMWEEWQAWQQVCRRLQNIGAVTAADLKAKRGSTGTPGLELIESITTWGDCLAALREAAIQKATHE